MSVLVSIITPCYNAAKYVAQCIHLFKNRLIAIKTIVDDIQGSFCEVIKNFKMMVA